jgi:S1-C subfamily serine protease
MNSDPFASNMVSLVLAWIAAIPILIRLVTAVLPFFEKWPNVPWILSAWVGLCFILFSPIRYIVFQVVLATSYLFQSWYAFLSTFFLFTFFIIPLAASVLYAIGLFLPWFAVVSIIGDKPSWWRRLLGAVAAPVIALVGSIVFSFVLPFAAMTTHWSRAEDVIGATNGPAYYAFMAASRMLAPVPDYFKKTPGTFTDYLRCHVAFYYLSESEQRRFLSLAYPSGSPTAGSNSNLAYSPPSPSATSRNIDIPTLVRQAKPAVVQIVTLDQNNKPLKTGTGFFISPDGDLLTNYHVIFDASSILAKTPSGAVYFLKGIVSVSPPADIALLQFYATDLPYLRLGSTTDAVEGQRVLVIGNPEGLEGTISDGIISAFRENRSMIQITAPISSGSSGSPVLDESGQVLGIATLISKEGQNLNFAISSESIREALSESSVITRSPSVPAASSTPTSTAVAKSTPSAIAPTQTPIAIGANWPDGRKLLHPDRFVKTRVVNVAANDTLKLRSGPGTSFKILAKIPANETNITAFNYDQVWDGDTYWCPVEWRGLRGYVGRSHLPKP